MILGGTAPTKTSPGEIAPGNPTAVADEGRSPAAVTPGHTGSRPATPPPSRCVHSDLPVDQCGDVCCRPDLEHALDADDWAPGANGAPIPVRHEGTWREAQYAGTCKCGCGQRYAEGADIVLAILGEARTSQVSQSPSEWCLLDHTRPVEIPDTGLPGGH